jgi:TIR domain
VAGPGAIKKPTVFLSHAATDEPIAQLIHDEIDRIFSRGVEIFASSVPGGVEPGTDWLDRIWTQLERAHAVVVVITPVSINRPWIWFEVGASWAKIGKGAGRILPVRVPEVDKGALPEPLGRLQALSLGDAAETKLLFRTLCDVFGFGDISRFRYARFKTKLPRYPDLPVSEADVDSGSLGEGSDEHLVAELEDLRRDNRRWFRDRDKRLQSEKAQLTAELNAAGQFHSGAFLQGMAIKQQEALYEYRDEMDRKRRRYRELRRAATRPLPRFALTDEQRAILASWRADIAPGHMPGDSLAIEDPTREDEEPDLRRFESEGDPPAD